MSRQPAAAPDTDEHQQHQTQCRICFDGPDPDLGRLIRPCLCSGTVSHVHVVCLQRWRNTSVNASAFFVCPQCHYRYRFARTKIVGLATNPASHTRSRTHARALFTVAIATLSTVLFTAIVYACSFLTTALLSSLDDPSYASYASSAIFVATGGGGGYWTWTNPYSVGRDLVRAALRILQDEAGDIFAPDAFSSAPAAPDGSQAAVADRGVLWRFVRRVVLGLPVVGAASLIHMLFSLPLLGPIQWIARSRGNQGRRNRGSRDTAAVIIVLLLVVGALRVIYQVYKFTEAVTKRVLLRAEASILEVNA
ncbi:hypothetical protein F5148DRAFT_646531 [Russula earlei]|uniref:Uncharacterized protein n=1 Tax=Russula earlei TaxID=71964 RepID=A0ACC0UM76_9AGAM|nr:hypothetical protein F5148DRAFT_646531 [Russula earlei]